MTERRNDRKTEGQTGQIQYSPHFFKAGKRGYNYPFLIQFVVFIRQSDSTDPTHRVIKELPRTNKIK